MKKYLTKVQVMEKTGWSARTLERMMQGKQLAYYKLGPEKQDGVRFLDSDIDRHMEVRRVEAKTA